MGKTRFQKIEERHLLDLGDGKKALSVGLHIVHEITSAQAFSSLRRMGLKVKHPENTFAVTDHVVPTKGTFDDIGIMDQILIKTLEENCRDFGITLYGMHNNKQGVCHVVAPDVGLTRPNITIFCGDSHTSTHGAFGAIAAGVGNSNVRDIHATGCLLNYSSPRQLKIEVNGSLKPWLSAKDVILYIMSKTGNAWATSGAVLFTGETIKSLSMEGRMTVCNMTIEMGGRFGYCDVDEKTLDWFGQDRDFFKQEDLTPGLKEDWLSLNTDPDAEFDDVLTINSDDICQMLTYGLTLNEVIPVSGKTGAVPGVQPARAGLEVPEGTPATEITFDHAFIGSCTNGRVEDFIQAAKVLKKHGGKVKIKSALAVPGSFLVKKRCEELGLDKVFTNAGFEWRLPGCSSCLAMNPDKFKGRVISATNRNFPGRQGPESRTFLASPASAAIAALEGKLTDLAPYFK